MKLLKNCILIAAASLLANVAMAQKGMENMPGMGMDKKPAAAAEGAHKASATVKKLNTKAGAVTLAHGPVSTMNWPAMTMTFKLADKSLLSKLEEGKKVDVEFIQKGDEYVVTAVK